MMRFAPMTSNNWFDSFLESFGVNDRSLMKTDIREKDGRFYLDIDLAGYHEEDISISLYNGTLTVTANQNSSNEETDQSGRLIRKERYSGTCSRSWNIGEGISETDIHAAFENGVLTVDLPSEAKKEEPQEKQIAIQ